MKTRYNYLIQPTEELLNQLEEYGYTDELDPFLLLVDHQLWFSVKAIEERFVRKDFLMKMKLLYLAELSRSYFGVYYVPSDLKMCLHQLLGEPPWGIETFDKWWRIEEFDFEENMEEVMDNVEANDLQKLAMTGNPGVDEWLSALIDKKMGNPKRKVGSLLSEIERYGKRYTFGDIHFVNRHPLADESAVLKILGMTASECIFTDLYWATDKQICFVSIWYSESQKPMATYHQKLGIEHSGSFNVITSVCPLTTQDVVRVLHRLKTWLETGGLTDSLRKQAERESVLVSEEDLAL